MIMLMIIMIFEKIVTMMVPSIMMKIDVLRLLLST